MADNAHKPPKARAVQPAGKETAESRLQLVRILLSSQEPHQQIRSFFRALAPRFGLTGLQYWTTEHDILELGEPGRHQCDYQLQCEQQHLGRILFTRDQRFGKDDQCALEQCLADLTLPLANALRYQEALTLSLRDSLTGVGNRAALDQALHRELRLAERYLNELSLLLIDVDHFKQVNDRFGHSLGDRALIQVARNIQNLCRESDLVFRYGGEEFVVLLSKTGPEGATTIAERIRQGIAQKALSDTVGERSMTLTVSIGISSRQAEGEASIHGLFDRADKALYRAKAQGRNRVMAEGDPLTGVSSVRA